MTMMPYKLFEITICEKKNPFFTSVVAAAAAAAAATTIGAFEETAKPLTEDSHAERSWRRPFATADFLIAVDAVFVVVL